MARHGEVSFTARKHCVRPGLVMLLLTWLILVWPSGGVDSMENTPRGCVAMLCLQFWE